MSHPPRSDAEQRLITRMRVATLVVFLGCILLIVVVDSVGRLLVDRDFHASDVFLLTLVGGVSSLITVEVLARVPKKGGHDSD